MTPDAYTSWRAFCATVMLPSILATAALIASSVGEAVAAAASTAIPTKSSAGRVIAFEVLCRSLRTRDRRVPLRREQCEYRAILYGARIHS